MSSSINHKHPTPTVRGVLSMPFPSLRRFLSRTTLPLLAACPLALAPLMAAAPPPTVTPAAAKPAKTPAAPMAFTPAELELAPGETYPVTLFVPSPTGKYFSGALSLEPDQGVTVQPDPRWPDRIPPWGVKVFPKITAAADAVGAPRVVGTLTGGGSATLKVTLQRPEVKLIPGIHALTIQVRNPMRGRTLKGRIGLTNADRFLGDVTSALFVVAPGATQETKIPLPGAAPVINEHYNFTYNLQTWNGYQEEKTLPLTFPPQRPAADGPP
jgi:hypothetical protein